MANVRYWLGTWVSSGPANDLHPGEAHHWVSWGFNYGDAMSLTAHPVIGAPVERYLAIEDVRIEGDPGGRRLFYTVRNVGFSTIPGYGVGYAWISA